MYLFATTSWLTANPFIISHGSHVLSWAASPDDTPFPSLKGFQQLVNSGKLRYVWTGGAPNFGSTFGASLATNTVIPITGYVESHCALVPGSDYGNTAPPPPPFNAAAASANPFAVQPPALWECSPGR